MKDLIKLSIQDVFEELKSSSKGLTEEEAQHRLTENGPNIITKQSRHSIQQKMLAQIKSWFNLLLIVAAILCFLGLIWELGLAIIIVVIVNIVFSLFQEARAEKAMDALKNYMPEYAKVIRNGKINKILGKELVPGDVIVIEEGDRVPADARVIEAFDLYTNNIPLTGESEPQLRTADASITYDGIDLLAPNLVFMSTSVVKGQGKAIISETGMQSRFGDIAKLTLEMEEPISPLQKELERTARYILLIALVLGMSIFLISFLVLHATLEVSLLFFIGVIVSCVPEGLQITVSSALAINVLKMTRQNVLVKRLSSIQTLGSVTIIATDKTGTITKGEMTVNKIFVPFKVIEVSGVGYTIEGDFHYNGKKIERGEINGLEKLLEMGALCNGARTETIPEKRNERAVFGDLTDGALLIAAEKYGFNIKNLNNQHPLLQRIPFDSERKKMSSFHKEKSNVVLYTKGAPVKIFEICNRVMIDDSITDFTPEIRSRIEEQFQIFAQSGLRLIAFAYRDLIEKDVSKGIAAEQDMIFVGIAAMEDPPRIEVKDAVELTKQAGVKIVIITGDAGPTARAIAEEVNITEPGKTEVIRGEDLERMDDDSIVDKIYQGNVLFARVTPREKLRIVTSLKNHGEILAVTGDGANDAPSLKEAEIGIAMGASGTDIAREASDMILLDDSFASITKAIESGRTIYENIRKFIIYVLTHNWAELIPFILYIVLGIPLGLLVVQILAIDLFLDTLPSLALSRDPPEPGIMQEPPRSIKEQLFNRNVLFRSIYVGIVIGVGAMLGCLFAWSSGGWHFGEQLNANDPVYIKGTTLTFAGIVIGQIGNLFSCRTKKASSFKISVKGNPWILRGVFLEVGILILFLYVPVFQFIFKTAALGFLDWLYIIWIPFVVLAVEELRKLLNRKKEDKSFYL